MSVLTDYLPSGLLVLDASAIINILGCGQARQVFEIIGGPCIVEERTRKEILRHPVPGLCHLGAFEEFENAGLLRPERMSAAEYEVYLSLIQGALSCRLGEGESAAISLATSRGCGIILDDNKARNIFGKRFAPAAYVSSLKLFISVACRAAWSVEYLRQIVDAATMNARMAVPRDERHLLDQLRCPDT